MLTCYKPHSSIPTCLWSFWGALGGKPRNRKRAMHGLLSLKHGRFWLWVKNKLTFAYSWVSRTYPDGKLLPDRSRAWFFPVFPFISQGGSVEGNQLPASQFKRNRLCGPCGHHWVRVGVCACHFWWPGGGEKSFPNMIVFFPLGCLLQWFWFGNKKVLLCGFNIVHRVLSQR